MPDIDVFLTQCDKDHLDAICMRVATTAAGILSLAAARLVDVDRMWKMSGIAGVTPNRPIPATDRQNSDFGVVSMAVSDDVYAGLSAICGPIGTSPADLLAMMGTGVVEEDRAMLKRGSEGLGANNPFDDESWVIEAVVEHTIYPATGNVRPGQRIVWPADKPFPLTDAECAALVRGHLVRWPGTIGEYLTELPGKYELSGGYLMVYET